MYKKTSGIKPSCLRGASNSSFDQNTVEKIIEKYNNHQSVRAVKSSVTHNNKSELPYATTQDINKIINSLKTDKATGPYGVPTKFIKLSLNAIDSHLTNTINNDFAQNNYSEIAKTANVRPIF